MLLTNFCKARKMKISSCLQETGMSWLSCLLPADYFLLGFHADIPGCQLWLECSLTWFKLLWKQPLNICVYIYNEVCSFSLRKGAEPTLPETQDELIGCPILIGCWILPSSLITVLFITTWLPYRFDRPHISQCRSQFLDLCKSGQWEVLGAYKHNDP